MNKTSKARTTILFCLIFSIKLNLLFAQTWQPTSGPAGGDIPNMAVHPTDSSIMYAVGRQDGLFKTTDYGENWSFIPFDIENEAPIKNILINETDPDIIVCSSNLDLIKTINGGTTWESVAGTINDMQTYFHVLVQDQSGPNTIYTGGGSHDPEVAPSIFMSSNFGETWTDIGASLSLSPGVFVYTLCAPGDGHVYVGINDESHEIWDNGKVFHTSNNGSSWNEVNYGQSEPRFIWSIHACAYDPTKVWISEGPLYNNFIEEPFIYYSSNSGASWEARIFNKESFDPTQIRIIGSSKTAENTYISSGGNLYVTRDNGNTLDEITCPIEILRFDLFNVYEQIDNPNKIFLPTGANGVAFSPDGGESWRTVNNGILNTSINLLSVDQSNPGILYASSSKGEGLFKTEDYGNTWEILNKNGIVHQWADEMTIDPTDPSTVYYISDVPYIHKSTSRGDEWQLTNNPYEEENFSFSSAYALAQSNDNNIIYATNNGFGIFKGTKQWEDESFQWEYLFMSDIDYTYSLAVEPDNENILYSGYNKKPFEDSAMIRASYDGGYEWFTSHKIEAEAFTSVEIDPIDKNNVLAASTGKEGMLWISNDKGQSWDMLNNWFSFTTVHSGVTLNNVTYAATWGGGMYKTVDYGNSWEKIESEQSFSAADVAVVDDGTEYLYVADRSKPLIYKSTNGGITWDTIFDAGENYRRIMSFEIDQHNINRIYATAMHAHGPGLTGDLFKIEGENVETITNELDKLPLSIKFSPSDSNMVYAVLHESGVYKSMNGGESWNEISDVSRGLPDAGFNDIVIDPNNPNILYLLGGSDVRFATIESAGLLPDSVMTVYRSDDNGESWENMSNGQLGENSGSIKDMEFYYGSSEEMYLATDNGVVYTINGGTDWIFDETIPFRALSGISIVEDTIIAFTKGSGALTGVINNDNSISWDNVFHFKNEIAFAQIVKHPTEPDILFASAYPGGIFKSYDYGETWVECNFGIPSFIVDDPLREGYYAIDINKDDPEIMYLGLYKRGIYRSFNGGSTWYPVNGAQWEMSTAPVTAIVSDVNNADIVYVGTLNGVYRTQNGGSTWTEFNTGMGQKEIRSLVMNPNGVLQAGTKGNGVYTLVGESWLANQGFGNWGTFWPMWDNRPMYQYTSLLIHPENNNRMMLGTFPQGIYISEDGGESWQESNIGWTNDGVFRLVCHPDNPEIVYSGTYNGLNISYDFGKSWEMADNGWPDEQWVFSIDFDPENPDIMYACSKNGENMGQGRGGFHGTVMKSLNGGGSWFAITNGLDIDQEFYQIICDKKSSGVLYLASQFDGVFKSDDGGTTWNTINDGLIEIRPGTNGNNVTNTLVLSDDNSMLYYGTAGTGVARLMLAPIVSAQSLAANVEEEDIQLNWSFTDVGQNFKQFNVYRSICEIIELSPDSLIYSISAVDSVFYIDSNIVEGQEYYYAVTVVNNEDYETVDYPTAGPIMVSKTNQAPFLNLQLEDSVAIVGSGFLYDLESNVFVDPDGNNITYSANELSQGILPDWLIFDGTELSFYGTPGEGDVGVLEVVITASDSYGAVARDTFNIVVENVVNINKFKEDEFNIYPIPANSFLTIKTVSLDEKYTVVLYSLTSKMVLSKKMYPVYSYPDKVQIDVSQLENGVYILVAKSTANKIVKKVVVSH